MNVTPATVPLSAPVTLQVASLFGPTMVSLPARPSNVTDIGTVLVVAMSIAMTSSWSLPSISMDVTSTRVTSSATPVSDSTSAALPSSKRSLWFQLLPACGDAFALPPSTIHTVAGAVGLTVAAAAGVACNSAVAVGAAAAASLVVVVVVADAAGAASVVVVVAVVADAAGAASVVVVAAAASGAVVVGALASALVVDDGAAGGFELATRRKPCVYVGVSVVVVVGVAVAVGVVVVDGEVAAGVAAGVSVAAVVASVVVAFSFGSTMSAGTVPTVSSIVPSSTATTGSAAADGTPPVVSSVTVAPANGSFFSVALVAGAAAAAVTTEYESFTTGTCTLRATVFVFRFVVAGAGTR